MIVLTDKGLGIVVALIVLAVLFHLTFDSILALAIGALLALISTDFLYAIALSRSPCSCDGEINERVWVWEEPSLKLSIKCRRGEGVEGIPSWLRVWRVEAVNGVLNLELRALFKSSGIYRVDRVVVRRSTIFGFFEEKRPISLKLQLKVYPEVLHWVVQALRILGIGGRAPSPVDLSDLSSSIPLVRTQSGAYYATREYTYGDLLRRVDWKATARAQKLMVKELREDMLNALVIAFDNRCVGPYTCDVVSSSALSIAMSALRGGTPLNKLYEVPEGKLITFKSTRSLLAYLVNKVLEVEVVDVLDVYEFVEPPTSGELRRILERMAEEGVQLVELSEPPLRVAGLESVALVTSLVHDVGKTVDLIDGLVREKVRVSVVVPSEPWLDARSLEEAYEIYQGFNLAIDKLKRMGIDVILWPRKLELLQRSASSAEEV